MNKKTLTILLLALLLVVVLFVVSLLLGAREPGSGLKLNLTSPAPLRIAGWLSRPAKAEYLTLRSGNAADCRLQGNQIIIRPGATCVYTVAADKLWTRQLRLKPASEDSAKHVRIFLKQQDALEVSPTLVPRETPKPLDIYGRQDRAPATLKIEALSLPLFDRTEYVIEIVAQ